MKNSKSHPQESKLSAWEKIRLRIKDALAILTNNPRNYNSKEELNILEK